MHNWTCAVVRRYTFSVFFSNLIETVFSPGGSFSASLAFDTSTDALITDDPSLLPSATLTGSTLNGGDPITWGAPTAIHEPGTPGGGCCLILDWIYGEADIQQVLIFPSGGVFEIGTFPEHQEEGTYRDPQIFEVDTNCPSQTNCYHVDVSTGTVQISPVPEPGPTILFIAGIFGILLIRGLGSGWLVNPFTIPDCRFRIAKAVCWILSKLGGDILNT